MRLDLRSAWGVFYLSGGGGVISANKTHLVEEGTGILSHVVPKIQMNIILKGFYAIFFPNLPLSILLNVRKGQRTSLMSR